MGTSFTASHTRGMESTSGSEETHARSLQHAQAAPVHRGCHGRDVGAQQRSIIVSDGPDLPSSAAYFLAFFCQVSCRWVASEWNGADLPSRDRPPHQRRTPAGSEHVEPILVSNKVGVGACPLEKATRTDASACIGVRSRISGARWGCAGDVSCPPEFGASFCTPQERDMSSSVNVYDKSLLLDNPECKLLDPVLNKLQD